MTLHKVRKAYENNYYKMLQTIQKMGGESEIKFHRKKKTPLYDSLRKLQKREHYLNDLEDKLLYSEENYQLHEL